MSAKIAHSPAVVVASNVKLWRRRRGLDQQGLADRLSELGWTVDRTAVTRIETNDRKVTVDDLALLAVALNVPVPLLMLPVHVETFADVALTPKGPTAAVYPWLMWEWMLGNEALPGPDWIGQTGDVEWRTGASPLWLYERVRHAQFELRRIERASWGHPKSLEEEDATAETRERWLAESAEYQTALQELVDAVSAMEDAGMPAQDGLIGSWAEPIRKFRIERSPAQRRRRIIGDFQTGPES
jgi:transcriptional regulator with XRE-family HTH domain